MKMSEAASTVTSMNDDPRPYMKIAGQLRDQITSGTLTRGTPVPTITTMSRTTGHARQTCGKALRMLEDEGLVTRIPGLGYYVTRT